MTWQRAVCELVAIVTALIAVLSVVWISFYDLMSWQFLIFYFGLISISKVLWGVK